MSSYPSPEAIAKYQQLMQECQQLVSKLAELETDRNEHKLVEEALTPLDPNRRAFRLVGGLLVERTVAEVLPSVSSNRENLDTVISKLQERLEAKQKEAAEHRTKHNIKVEQQ